MTKNHTNKKLWIDAHTHLNMLDIPAQTALESAQAVGVWRVSQ